MKIIFLISLFFTFRSFADEDIESDLNEGKLNPPVVVGQKEFKPVRHGIVRSDQAPAHSAASPAEPPPQNLEQKNSPDAKIETPFNLKIDDSNMPISEQIKMMILAIKDVPEETIKENMLAKLNEGALKTFISTNPKVMTFLVRMMKSEQALPEFAKLIEEKSKMATFGIAMLGTFILGLILKMQIKKNKSSEGIPLVSFLPRFIFLFCLRIILVIYFFHKEAAPTFKIAKDVFLS